MTHNNTDSNDPTLIGPSACTRCGGEYGEHEKWCNLNNTDSNQQQGEALEPCPFCGGPAEKRLTDGPKRGFIGCFTCMIGLPFNAPYGNAETAAWNTRPAPAAAPPMCAVHAALDGKDKLTLEVGNGCIACSLHERTALLNLLEPFAADDASQDSLTVLRNLIASRASIPAVEGDAALILLDKFVLRVSLELRDTDPSLLSHPAWKRLIEEANALLKDKPQGVYAASSPTPAEPVQPCCFCGAVKDDPVHAYTYDAKLSHAFIPKTNAAPTQPWRDEGGHAWEVKQNVTGVECPHCCFTFAAVHTDGNSDGYSCPNCEGCPDAAPVQPDMPNHALVQLLESALLHPESAEGNIRQVIETLNAAADENKRLREHIADLNHDLEASERHCKEYHS